MNAAEQQNALRIMEVDVWRLRDDGRVLYGGAVGAVDEVDDDGVDTVDEQVVVGEVAGDGVSVDASASVDASDKVDAGKVADDGVSDQVVTGKVASDGESVEASASVDASDQVAVGKVAGDGVSGGANAGVDASDQVAVGKVVGDSVSGGTSASDDANDQVVTDKVAGDSESAGASASASASVDASDQVDADQVVTDKVVGDGVSAGASASVDASDQVAVGKVAGDSVSAGASASDDASDQVAVGKVAGDGVSGGANASVDASDQVAVGKVAGDGESVDASASDAVSDDASDDAGIATEPPVDETLDIIRQQVAQCTQCALHQSRKQTVFGVGDARADWLFVGEAPGREEDLQGEPFVGRAGKLLDLMLAALGMSREAVFIANVLKCRPPENRDPTAEEVALCENYLHRQLAIIQPKIIVALGRISAQALLKTDQPLAKLRGATHAYGRADTPLVVTYHPAYLLRSPGQKEKAWEDLWRAKMIVDES